MKAVLQRIGSFRGATELGLYTIHTNGNKLPDYSDFVTRMSEKMNDINELTDLIQFITEIAFNWGYEDEYFQTEANALRFLTPQENWVTTNSSFGVRLYCVVLEKKVVIILNGDLKTAQKNQDCPNCLPHFENAKKIAAAIYRDYEKGEIGCDGIEIDTDKDYTINY